MEFNTLSSSHCVIKKEIAFLCSLFCKSQQSPLPWWFQIRRFRVSHWRPAGRFTDDTCACFTQEHWKLSFGMLERRATALKNPSEKRAFIEASLSNSYQRLCLESEQFSFVFRSAWLGVCCGVEISLCTRRANPIERAIGKSPTFYGSLTENVPHCMIS